jgi:hypothetical protein
LAEIRKAIPEPFDSFIPNGKKVNIQFRALQRRYDLYTSRQLGAAGLVFSDFVPTKFYTDVSEPKWQTFMSLFKNEIPEIKKISMDLMPRYTKQMNKLIESGHSSESSPKERSSQKGSSKKLPFMRWVNDSCAADTVEMIGLKIYSLRRDLLTLVDKPHRMDIIFSGHLNSLGEKWDDWDTDGMTKLRDALRAGLLKGHSRSQQGQKIVVGSTSSVMSILAGILPIELWTVHLRPKYCCQRKRCPEFWGSSVDIDTLFVDGEFILNTSTQDLVKSLVQQHHFYDVLIY